MPTNELVIEFRTLLERRDCMAYRLVDVAMAACAYLNLGEIEKAQNILQGSLLEFQLVDDKVTNFYKESGSHAHKIPAQSADTRSNDNAVQAS